MHPQTRPPVLVISSEIERSISWFNDIFQFLSCLALTLNGARCFELKNTRESVHSPLRAIDMV